MKEINGMQKKGAHRQALRTVCGAVAVALCGLAASGVQAQTYTPLEQGWEPDADADVIKLTGEVQVTHDDNLLRVKDAEAFKGRNP